MREKSTGSFLLDDEYDTRIIVVEHNIFRVTVRIFEDSTGKEKLIHQASIWKTGDRYSIEEPPFLL